MSRMLHRDKQIKHLPKSPLAELLGWIGAGAILVDYALLSLGILDGNSAIYHGIFLLGSAGLAIVTYRHRAFQSFAVNVIFIVIAVIAVYRLVFFA